MCWCTDNWHAGISCSTKSRSRGQACGWFVSWNIWASLSFFILTSSVVHECGAVNAWEWTKVQKRNMKNGICTSWMNESCGGQAPSHWPTPAWYKRSWIIAIQQPNTIWSSETARFAVLVGSLSARISEFLFHWSFWDATTYMNVSIAFWLLLW